MRLANTCRAILLGASILALISLQADAAIILQYDFAGQPGTETSVNSSFATTGVSGIAFRESSALTPAGAVNFISSTGWQNAGAAYTFGLNVNAGQVVTINDIDFSSRSSNTGPGFLNLMASVDGAAAVTVATFTESNGNYSDLMLAITPVIARKSLIFSIVAANTTSAVGGTTAGTGTFRVGNYAPGGTQVSPFTINGSIMPAGGAAVPEPASCLMLSLGVVGGLIAARRRFVQ